jgi:hypothetical protein
VPPAVRLQADVSQFDRKEQMQLDYRRSSPSRARPAFRSDRLGDVAGPLRVCDEGPIERRITERNKTF